MKVEYSHTNSGGGWWLADKHWEKLAANGWEVRWQDGGMYADTPKKGAKDTRPRFLGALATHASKDFPTLKAAVVEWERLLGMDASEEGCPCCGAPHSFEGGEGEDRQYVSGREIAYLKEGK